MNTLYNIIVSIRTPQKMLEVGHFLIGNDYEFSRTTFDSLKGSKDVDKFAIRIDLTKKTIGTPHVCLDSIGCTLDEYVKNCKTITRDAFKFFSLENGSSLLLDEYL